MPDKGRTNSVVHECPTYWLWAIEDALTDRDRRDIARDEALPLLLVVEDAQKPVP